LSVTETFNMTDARFFTHHNSNQTDNCLEGGVAPSDPPGLGEPNFPVLIKKNKKKYK